MGRTPGFGVLPLRGHVCGHFSRFRKTVTGEVATIHNDIRRLAAEQETIRRYEATEMHVFDDDAVEEEALCKVDVSNDCIRSATYYLEDRLHGARVGVVCEGCKLRAIPFAVNMAQDLEAEGLLDEAEEYHELAAKLLRETTYKMAGPLAHMWASFSFIGVSLKRELIWGRPSKPG